MSNATVLNEEYSGKALKEASKQQQLSIKEAEPPAASLAELYQYATSYDIFLMVIGTITASASGFCQPAFCLLFGLALDKLNSNDISASINVLVVYLVILGIGNFVVSAISAGCWGKLLC